MKADLIERYAVNLHGVLSCFDRILITGTLPGACYALGMTGFLNAHRIRILAAAQRDCLARHDLHPMRGFARSGRPKGLGGSENCLIPAQFSRS
jgi:hypothetical protein